jgi:hypothetical protein
MVGRRCIAVHGVEARLAQIPAIVPSSALRSTPMAV